MGGGGLRAGRAAIANLIMPVAALPNAARWVSPFGCT